MANIKSAKKRIRTSTKSKVRNIKRKRVYKSKIKDILKKIKGQTDIKEIQGEVGNVHQAIDKAAGKGTIHKNKAARLKSRLAKQINRMGMRGKWYQFSIFNDQFSNMYCRDYEERGIG